MLVSKGVFGGSLKITSDNITIFKAKVASNILRVELFQTIKRLFWGLGLIKAIL